MRAGTAHSLCGGKNLFTTEYPLWSMLAAQVLLYLVPFVSAYLALLAFAICVYRIVRFDARVFAVDYCMLIPVAQMFRAPGGMSLLIFLCLFAAVWYFWLEGVKGESTVVILVLMLCYFLLRMQMDIGNFLLCFGQLFSVYILLSKQDDRSAECGVKFFCVSLIVSSLYALLLRDSYQLYALRGSEVPAYWGSSVRRFQGLFEDTNYYMSLVITGLTGIIKLRYYDRLRKSWFLCAGVILTVLGILTYSKTFILLYLVLAAVSIVWLYGEGAPHKAVILGLAGVLLIAVALFAEFSPLMVIVTRLTESANLSDFTTGRSELFASYFAVIVSDLGSLLFGEGLGADILVKAPHNLYLEIAYYTGTVGLVLFLAYGVSLGRSLHAGRGQACARNGMAIWFSLLMIMILYCALHGMFSVVTYGVFFLAFLSIRLDKRKETE